MLTQIRKQIKEKVILSNKVWEMIKLRNEIKKFIIYTIIFILFESLLILWIILFPIENNQLIFLPGISLLYGGGSLVFYLSKMENNAKKIINLIKYCYNCGTLLRSPRGDSCPECDFKFPFKEFKLIN